MTQTKIDIDHAKAPEIIRALAEQLCPDCTKGQVLLIFDRPFSPPGNRFIPHKECDGIGLANLWASEECFACKWEQRLFGRPCIEGAWPETSRCNGSGRVPKDVGLEELWEHGLLSVRELLMERPDGKYEAMSLTSPLPSHGETPLLAALRVVGKAQGL